MAVNITVLSTFNDAGLKRARAEMDKLSKKVESSTSKTVRSAAALGGGVLAGAGVAVGALYKIGSSFDDAYDNLRVNTGKTGAELDVLKNDLRAVASQVPDSFDQVSVALAGFASNLGLSGKPLEDLSVQILNLSRLTGTDLNTNVDAVSKVMKNFGVITAYQGPALDVMFRASQQTGISISDLATQMATAGPVLRSAGFDFQSSAAFTAQLAKAGLDVGDVMPTLSKSLALAAKNGQDAGTYLGGAFDRIKNAPNDVAASQIAMEQFGAKGAKMAELVRSGAVSFDELKNSIGQGDSINQAASDTEDFSEKFSKLKNRIMLAIEPFASKVFDKIGEIMDWLGPKVDQVTKYFQEHQGVAKVVAGIIGGALVIALIAVNVQLVLMAINVLAATWPIILIIGIIALLVAGFIYAWNNFDWFRNGILTAWELIKEGFSAAWDFIKMVFQKIWDAVQWVWEKFNWLKDTIGDIFIAVGSAIVAPFKAAFNLIVDIWNATVGGLGFTVPDWVKYIPGGGSIAGKSITIPKLTRWAHTGGIVTGAPGASVPMMLQTGEMVLSQDQQAMLLGRANGMGGGSNVTINVTVAPTADKAAVGQAIAEALSAYERRSGAGWRAA
jgi:TP901 family phage tail tape measure protein